MNSLISGYSVLCSFYTADATNSTGDDGILYNTISQQVVTAPNKLLQIPADKTFCRPEQQKVRYIFSAASDYTYVLKSDMVMCCTDQVNQTDPAGEKYGGHLLCARIAAGDFL